MRLSLISRRFIYFSVCSCMAGNVGAAPIASPLLNTIEGMSAGSWAKVNTNKFQDVWTPTQYQLPQPLGNNESAIISAWSSFAWDSNRGEAILYGGGHANYPGNEVYVWKSSTLQWERASLPTAIKQVATPTGSSYVTVDNGASPLAAHTYDNSVYLSKADRFLTFGGASYNSGSIYAKQDASGALVSTGPYAFDPSRANGNLVGGADGTGVDSTIKGGNMWQNLDIFANQSSSVLPQQFVNGMADATVENGKDVVYVVGSNQTVNSLYRYEINDINNPSLNTWSLVGTYEPHTLSGLGTGAYDPVHKLFIRTGDVYNYFGTTITAPFFYWDLNHPSAGNPELIFNPVNNTSGALTFTHLKDMGFEYDPIGGRFLLWGGGNDVYSLSGDFGTGWTLTVENIASIASGPGGAGVANDYYYGGGGGVLGKWHYAPDLGVFVGLKDPFNGDVWMYKPSNWISPIGGGVAVAEPHTLSMLLAGLGFIGWQRRRARVLRDEAWMADSNTAV
ncbi:MAG: hypothetical protein PHE55_14925 [Methylococcaceae bacterium]|nr:hypothetical protein [Methylococcaceae bacterium]